MDLCGEACQCPDRPPEGERCKHLYAATIARAKSGECSGCSKKVRRRELHPVSDGHLTFFEGDELCEGCAVDSEAGHRDLGRRRSFPDVRKLRQKRLTQHF